VSQHIKLLVKANPEKLSDITLIKHYLSQSIKLVGMEPLGDPVVWSVPLDPCKLGGDTFQDEGGVTSQLVGFSTLTTSHIAIHTWPLRSEAHIDLYSCKEFDSTDFISWTHTCLSATVVKTQDLSYACRW